MSGQGKPDSNAQELRQLAVKASLVSFLMSGLVSPCLAQGMMEYGSLMASPKAMPNAGTINALTKPFSGYSLPGGAPPAVNDSSVNGQLASFQIMGPDGNPQVDPKKVKMIADRAAKAYELGKAKAKLASPSLKDLKEGESNLREAITLRNSVWGYQDPTIPGMLNLLGSVYEKQKQPASAESCYKSALVYINRRSGTTSYDRIDTLNNLAKIYEKTGQNKEALDNYSQVGKLRERQSGEDSLASIKARLNWARVAGQMDKPEAESLFERCLKSLEKADRSKEAQAYKKVISELANDFPAYLSTHERATLLSEVKVRISALEGADSKQSAAGSAAGSESNSQSAKSEASTKSENTTGEVKVKSDTTGSDPVSKGNEKSVSKNPG